MGKSSVAYVRLTPEVDEFLEKQAEILETTKSDLARDAIVAYMLEVNRDLSDEEMAQLIAKNITVKDKIGFIITLMEGLKIHPIEDILWIAGYAYARRKLQRKPTEEEVGEAVRKLELTKFSP